MLTFSKEPLFARVLSLLLHVNAAGVRLPDTLLFSNTPKRTECPSQCDSCSKSWMHHLFCCAILSLLSSNKHQLWRILAASGPHTCGFPWLLLLSTIVPDALGHCDWFCWFLLMSIDFSNTAFYCSMNFCFCNRNISINTFSIFTGLLS